MLLGLFPKKNILYTNVFVVDVALIGLYIKINATSF